MPARLEKQQRENKVDDPKDYPQGQVGEVDRLA